MPTSPAINLALHFINRELRSRYLGSLSGGVWALGCVRLPAVRGRGWLRAWRQDEGLQLANS